MKNMTTRLTQHLVGLALVVFSAFTTTHAATFSLPPTGKSLLGALQSGYSQPGENLATLAQRYDVGYNSIIDANPGINSSPDLNATSVIVPTLFLLPPIARRGIVINLPEMRMYFYPTNSGVVMTFPIGIGRVGKTIPITTTAVTRKAVDPSWKPTPAIREFNRTQGIELPDVMPAGPDNPLGPYAIYLGVPTYLIHSTIFPESIGKRASFGCIRMNETDIREFFPLVKPGTTVSIINIPTKINWEGEQLFLEAHPPLEEHNTESLATPAGVVRAIEKASEGKLVMVDWQLVSNMLNQRDGIPRAIGVKVR